MKSLIALSGGLDSTSLLGYFKEQGNEVTGVSFTYGSKHNKYENKASKLVAKYYGIKLIEMDISPMMIHFKSDLLKSGGKIPEGHYQAENMKSTVVPARNIIFISIMAGLAESINASVIGIGVHAGDHFIYPDCRPDFISRMRDSIYMGTDNKVILQAPFLNNTKAEIIKKTLAFKKAVPFSLTRTCYKDQEIACGVCGSCVERLCSFHMNNIKDPIRYKE